MLRVLMVAAECAPFAKAGGLADVLGALPMALEKLGVSVTIAIPRHRVIDLRESGFEPVPSSGDARVSLGFESIPYEIHRSQLPRSSVEVFLIGNDRFFDRPGIYVDSITGHDYADQADRWIFFQRATMEFFKTRSPAPDVLHCHDHQTGLLPAYLPRFYRMDKGFAGTRSMFTIHNIGYQGRFPRDVLFRAGFGDSAFYPMSPFEFYGMVNFMKAGIEYADLITTVSPTYAREIQESSEFAFGLEGVLRERSHRLLGILNGIDDELWDPKKDPFIPNKYSKTNVDGKLEDKKALLQKYNLDSSHIDWPLLAMISRIEAQKGFDLLVSILEDLLAKDLYFVLLGSGNKETEKHLRTIIERHAGKAGIRFEFDNGSAHLVEAGADIFLMPSKYEPCGLNQMYSLRYGTVPVVRKTGGLADTIREYDPSTGEGTGFVFSGYDPEQFKAAIDRALALWPQRTRWRQLMRNGMSVELGWKESARKYVEAYELLRKM
ncbi:MAG: glycogen synthase GlgA [Acidobacteria bacterium]|nr:MAG: glycogen synthase GlgA [Acidobacteriota bacterium]